MLKHNAEYAFVYAHAMALCGETETAQCIYSCLYFHVAAISIHAEKQHPGLRQAALTLFYTERCQRLIEGVKLQYLAYICLYARITPKK